MKKIAIITSHPIQYNAPLFRKMAQLNNIQIKVFYTAGKGNSDRDAGFGREIKWDIPLLDGYDHEFLSNTARKPGLGRFFGIRNPMILSRIGAYDPDILWVYGWNYVSHFKVMRHFKGKIPVWFRGDSTLMDENPGFKKLFRRILLQWVYQHIDLALYVGKANKDYFKAHGIREDQLAFIPHAVDNNHFYDSTGKKYEERAWEWRKELGVPKNALVFLFAGKFTTKKDPLLLIKAFKKLISSTLQPFNPSTHQPLFLILVGNGPLESRLKKEAADHPNILFLPFQNQSQMPVVYRLGDVYVLPSRGPGETWGLAVNEAMASERCILISNKVGCSEDLLVEGVNGFRFKSGDVMSLFERLKQLTQMDISQMGSNSVEEIKKWNYDRICDTIRNMLIT